MISRITRRRPSPSMIVALLALGVALGGTSYAALTLPSNSVGTKQLKRNAVTGAKVKNRSLRTTDFARGQLPQGPQGPKGDPGTPAALPAAEPWKPLPFGAGWADYGEGHVPAAYRKDPLGKVHLRGLVSKTGGTPTIFDAIATLPEGYRPPGSTHFAVALGRPDAAGTAYVQSNGTVTWLSGTTGETDYTDLSAVSFWPE